MTTRLQIIRFTSRENFTTERKYATKINKWLAVVPGYDTYKIFRIDTGLPLIETEFKEKEKAIELAQWIAKCYDGYFEIWEAWPECELLRVAQYTIPNGEQVYKRIEEVQNHVCIG